jgi:[lysine-biosynthesis-protein LysW]--L-2-aminoadipate ligase
MPPTALRQTMCGMARVAIIGWSQETNVELTAAWRDLGLDAQLVNPAAATMQLQPGDIAVGRLDVRRTLDGVEPGLHVLSELGEHGVRVLNQAHALLGAHDKLLTAATLGRIALPHPRTLLLFHGTDLPIDPPFVLKPRFGSWGADVFRCRNHFEAVDALAEVADRRWFRRYGAIVQELLPARGYDLRLIVAGGEIVGAVSRIAAPGEWRTNISLGGTKEPVDPPEEAQRLALAAAEAIDADLVGVDLLPVDGGYVVLELNGSVEFDGFYSLPGRDVYRDAAGALELPGIEVAA